MTPDSSVSPLSPVSHVAPDAPAVPLVPPPAPPVVIRPVTTIDELAACVAMQYEVWGATFGDGVPASLMLVAEHLGGLALGAFAPDGELLGFVFGLTGVKDDEVVHWSHLLAVRERARSAGLGRRLKERQRVELARRGIARVFWTFDPLQARNAHLNLNRLGARVVEYVPNMYGVSASALHYSLETDRLVVVERTDAAAPAPSPALVGAAPPILTPFPRPGDVLAERADAALAAALVELPDDLHTVVASSRETAEEWRLGVRRHLQWALGHGFEILALHRDAAAGRAFYVVARPPAAGPLP